MVPTPMPANSKFAFANATPKRNRESRLGYPVGAYFWLQCATGLLINDPSLSTPQLVRRDQVRR